jgi:alanine dehydrogenase
MLIGVPKEIKTNENRIALVPAGAEALTAAGHTVFIEAGAGLGSGFPDDAYQAAGAQILPSADEVWRRAEMIMKVKEPIAPEWPRMRKGQLIYTYFHFAAAEDLTRAVIDSGAVAVAYETVQLPSGELPLLTPMSEVAGRMAVQEGAKYLERVFGGSGVLLGGVPGVAPGEVVIIGGGVVGINAAKMAAGLGAHVTILDISLDRLRYLDDVLPANVDTGYSNRHNILAAIARADLVIGAVLLHGARAPHVIKRDQLSLMNRNAVLVDVAIDQGGCFETSKPTTHSDPVYEVDGITHYCVANMPGAVPITSTYALTNATLPYVLSLADNGVEGAIARDPGLRPGVNVAAGKVTHEAVAEGVGAEYGPVERALGLGSADGGDTDSDQQVYATTIETEEE